MSQKLTLQFVRKELALVGATIRKDQAGDYVVRLKGAPKGEGYFTNDLQDALSTGNLIAERSKPYVRVNLFEG